MNTVNISSQRIKLFHMGSSFPSSLLCYLLTVLVLGCYEEQHRAHKETETQRNSSEGERGVLTSNTC